MKKQITFLSVLVLLGAAQAARQGGGGFGYFGPTVAQVDYAGVNAALGRAGFTDTLSSLHWMMGGGGYALAGRVIIGGSGWGGDQNVSSSTLNCRVTYFGGQFEVGYAPLVTRHFIVAPALGIGGSGCRIALEQATSDVENLDSLLARPGRTSQLSFSRLTLTPELIVHVPISFVGIQLKAGYLYSPTSPVWKLDDGGRLLKAPKMSTGAAFLGLNVAFGGAEEPRERVRARARRARSED